MPRESERFIHDNLLKTAERMAERMREDWKKHLHIKCTVVTWPRETIKSDNGKDLEHEILMFIPDSFDPAMKKASLKRMVARTKAYGIALVERQGYELRTLFETQHGARAWIAPLERHGDILVPGPTVVRDNAESLGLIWLSTN